MLKGNKILLRSVEKRDLNLYYEMWSDEDVRKYDSGFTIAPSKEHIIENFEFVMNSSPKYLTVVNEKGVTVGYLTYEVVRECKNVYEIGITIGKNFRGRGYSKDCIKTIVNFLFLNAAAERIELRVVDDNSKAINCYKSCGFIEEGKLRSRFFSEGKYKDVIVMAIIKEDFYKLCNLK